MQIYDDLSEYQANRREINQHKKEIYTQLIEKFKEKENDGKKPEIIIDTLYTNIEEKYAINKREAFSIIREICADSNGTISNDGTVIYTIALVKCQKCPARYSSKIARCPSCKSTKQ